MMKKPKLQFYLMAQGVSRFPAAEGIKVKQFGSQPKYETQINMDIKITVHQPVGLEYLYSE